MLRSDHVTVQIGRVEFLELLDDFCRCMDQPTIDGLNTYLISHAAAKQGLKVALSGLGGDELFGGYHSFREIPELLKWGHRFAFSKPLDCAVRSVVRSLPAIPPKLAGLLSHSRDIASAYLLRRSLFLADELDSVIDESWLHEGLEKLATIPSLIDTISTLRARGATLHVQVAALESCWYMRNQLLRDTDWSSMAHGLEVRVPFVDATLLQHLGPAIASDRPPSKRELAACAQQLPPAVLNRPKTGFTTPVRGWIASDAGSLERGLRGWAGEVHRKFRATSSLNRSPASSLIAA
jgi:asparagine synthase (glutamine-hydrolysing)